ncbi:MAG: serine protease [Flavobacteriaceae bacterium]|nr:serine protease [Flavobacteriaceae bacterium]
MRNFTKTIWIFSIFIIAFVNCSKDDTILIPDPPIGIIETGLIKLEDAVNHSNTNFANLVNKVRGSVGTIGPGSKVIWSKKNDYKLGIYISANHVYGLDTWNNRSESYIDILSINNGIFLTSQIPPVNGNVLLNNELIADFGLYHSEIPISATNTTILPKNDFYIGIIDNQRVIDNGLGVYPNNVQINQVLQMYDPNGRTTSAQTWANTIERDTILVVGYPQDRTEYPNGAVSTGKVFTDTQAQIIIQQLKEEGDEEGNIPYNHQVEFITNAKAIAGMSGGGVFNSQGQLLGISVRATTLENEPILRVVRITFIKDKLSSFYNNLSSTDKNKLHPFISGEL